MNKHGHPETLVARQPGNQNARRHGAHARDQSPSENALDIAAQLRGPAHVTEADSWLTIEAGCMIDLAKRLDADISSRGVLNKDGELRSVVDMRVRVGRRIERLLEQLLLTPRARAAFSLALAQASLARELDEGRRRRGDGNA